MRCRVFCVYSLTRREEEEKAAPGRREAKATTIVTDDADDAKITKPGRQSLDTHMSPAVGVGGAIIVAARARALKRSSDALCCRLERDCMQLAALMRRL